MRQAWPKAYPPGGPLMGQSRTMPAVLFVVAPSESRLYQHLRQAFAGTGAVEIVVDRRRRDRRQLRIDPPAERRRGSERRLRDLSRELDRLGYALVSHGPRRLPVG